MYSFVYSDYLPFVFSQCDEILIQTLLNFKQFVHAYKLEVYVQHVPNVKKRYFVYLYLGSNVVLRKNFTVSKFADIFEFVDFLSLMYTQLRTELVDFNSLRVD